MQSFRLWMVVSCAAVLFLFRHDAFAATVTVRIPSLEASSGRAVNVPIEVAGATGIGALQFAIVYDFSVIRPDTVTAGPLASNALLEFNSNNQGRLAVGIATLDDIKGDGVIATARFKVVGKERQTSALTITSAEAWEGASHEVVMVQTQAGKVTVVGGLPWWLMWLLIVLAVLILLSLLWFFLWRGRHWPITRPTLAVGRRGGPFCSYCGSSNEADSKFCTECGKPLPQIAT